MLKEKAENIHNTNARSWKGGLGWVIPRKGYRGGGVVGRGGGLEFAGTHQRRGGKQWHQFRGREGKILQVRPGGGEVYGGNELINQRVGEGNGSQAKKRRGGQAPKLKEGAPY